MIKRMSPSETDRLKAEDRARHDRWAGLSEDQRHAEFEAHYNDRPFRHALTVCKSSGRSDDPFPDGTELYIYGWTGNVDRDGVKTVRATVRADEDPVLCIQDYEISESDIVPVVDYLRSKIAFWTHKFNAEHAARVALENSDQSDARRLARETNEERVVKRIAAETTAAVAAATDKLEQTIAKLRSDLADEKRINADLSASKKKLREALNRLKEVRA